MYFYLKKKEGKRGGEGKGEQETEEERRRGLILRKSVNIGSWIIRQSICNINIPITWVVADIIKYVKNQKKREENKNIWL